MLSVNPFPSIKAKANWEQSIILGSTLFILFASILEITLYTHPISEIDLNSSKLNGLSFLGIEKVKKYCTHLKIYYVARSILHQ